jgi:hypothetical protein
MLKRLSQHERLALLIGEWEPIIRQAFLDAVADIRSKITLRVLIERLERKDIPGVAGPEGPAGPMGEIVPATPPAPVAP